MRPLVLLFCLLTVISDSVCFAQEASYSDGHLNVKKRFTAIEVEALTADFRGITTSTGKREGLFPIKQTGVSTAPIVRAAQAYLSLLSAPELIRTQFAVDDPEWRRWFNVDNGIYVRQGLSLKEMNEQQRAAAWHLFQVSLSAKGIELSRNIMKTDQTLAELNDSLFLDEQLYFLTVMGTPSEKKPWGWQLDGHHLVINYFVMGDQVVMTPSFWGAEPAITTSGKYAGNTVLQNEQNQGLAFMQKLSAEQQKKATLDTRKTKDDMQAGAHKDNLVLDYAGLNGAAMTATQQQELLELISLYISNLREGHAEVRMDEVKTHLNDTWFAWIGGTTKESVFYYRIHSPVLLIEFDHQRPVGTAMLNQPGIPTRDHIHIIVRTPNGNDYGKDLLGQHLAKHAH
ncbi:DUF3500 domain-containing protein [Pseudidiomarina sp. CB1]|uniref:DUF3500 domain-containing protein n=1 Tax=Pseudidiomarina sp. CB1 TaxID=2972484 RepID=UPI0021615968|nr:DUF3500 domain-containing protein [Pseudidiomarina sp. CB1]